MNPYFEQMILSASPIELVRLLYQRAIASVADAREHLREGRIRERAQNINRAYAILSELLVSLDVEKAPELAGNLRMLYCYMQKRLIEANFSQADAPLEETGRLLTTLADAWQEVPHIPCRDHEDGFIHDDAFARAGYAVETSEPAAVLA